MARIKGPRKVSRYTAEFKLKAVKLRVNETTMPRIATSQRIIRPPTSMALMPLRLGTPGAAARSP